MIGRMREWAYLFPIGGFVVMVAVACLGHTELAIALGGVSVGLWPLLWALDRPLRYAQRAATVKIEPRLSIAESRSDGIQAGIGVSEAAPDVLADRMQAAFDAGVAMAEDMALMRHEGIPPFLVPSPESRGTRSVIRSASELMADNYRIPGPVSRETLDAVRDAFAPSGRRDPDLGAWDATVEALHLNIKAAEDARVAADQAKAVYDRAMLLSARVTPELMALPIPTAVREILEELAELNSPAETEA